MTISLSVSSSPRILLTVLLSITIAIVLFVYQPGLQGPYTFDDILIFPSTQLPKMDYDSVRHSLAMHNSGIFGRPLTILSQILNHHMTGPNPIGYKWVNLIIHCANTALISVLSFVVLNIINHKKTNQYSLPFLVSVSMLVSLAWAIHPLQISTVHYIFQRSVLLSSFFTLSALLLYCHIRTTKQNNAVEVLSLLVAIPTLIAMATASKENGILIIPFLVLIELTVLSNTSLTNSHSRILKYFFVLILGLPTLCAVLFFLTHTSEILEHYASRDFTLIDRLRTESIVLFFYSKLIYFPNIDDMSLYHDAFPIFRKWSIAPIAATLGIAITAGAVLVLRKRASLFSFGLGLFLISHSLESTFIPLELVFEHRNYIAMYGLLLPVFWYSASIARNLCFHQTASLLGILILIILGSQSYSRSIEWSNEMTLNSMAVVNQPMSFRAKKMLAVSLSNNDESHSAINLLDEAIEQHPKEVSAWLLKVALYCNARIEEREPFEKAVSTASQIPLKQDVVGVLQGLMAMTANQKCELLDFKYLSRLASALTNNNDKRMKSIFSLSLYALQSQIQLYLGKVDEAIESLESALAYKTDHAEILAVLTSLYLDTHQPELAMKHLIQLKQTNDKSFFAFQALVDDLEDRVSNEPSLLSTF